LWFSFRATCVLLAAMIATGMIWTRGQRILGNDSFYYLEFAKQFREHFPTRFGDWWPFGFPLAGAFLSRLTGISAHSSLNVVSALAFASIIYGFLLLLPRTIRTKPSTFLFIGALACAPVCALLLLETLSEPLFAAAIFCLAFSLAFWPKPSAIISSVALSLLAFCIRYAGIFTFAIVPCFVLLNFRQLIAAKKLLLVAAAYVLGFTGALALMYTNYRYFGHVTGPQAVGKESLTTWPIHLADFGWAPLGAFISGSLLTKVGGIKTFTALIVGWSSAALMLGLCFVAWRRPFSRFSQPMSLVAAAYLISIVTLRATTPFDAVSNPRTFLPILFPLAFLVFRKEWKPFLMPLICLSLVTSLLLASRGISKETYGETSGAAATLKQVVAPESTIAVNGAAASLAAYFPNHFWPATVTEDGRAPIWGPTPRWSPEGHDFIVIAATRSGRQGKETSFQGNWLHLIATAVNNGKASMVESNINYIILRGSPTKAAQLY
jgi:hypothetical protein